MAERLKMNMYKVSKFQKNRFVKKKPPKKSSSSRTNMITLEIGEPNKNEMRGNEGKKQNQNPPHFKIQHKDSDCGSSFWME